MARLNKNLSGTQIADEIINRTSSTSLGLDHDTIMKTGFEIWTGAGGTGTQLTLTTDYTLGSEDSALSSEAGDTIYTKVAIVNGAYHSTNLYVTYKSVGDYVGVEDVIIESGYVSGRGWYVKFGDGTMIETIENTLSATAAGDIATTGAFPVPFYTQPSGLIAPHYCSATNGMANMVAIKGAGPSAGSKTTWYSRVSVGTSSYVTLQGVFVGRWKA